MTQRSIVQSDCVIQGTATVKFLALAIELILWPVWKVLDIVAWALQITPPSQKRARRKRPIYRSW